MPAYPILPDQCTWLMKGATYHCPRKSRGPYCSQHLFQMRGGCAPLNPCKLCSKGTNSKNGICLKCYKSNPQCASLKKVLNEIKRNRPTKLNLLFLQ